MRILCVHAHPDDESSKGAGTIARYADAGAVATLVCCTGGVQMGTRMLSAAESPVHDNWKVAVVAAAETDTVQLNRGASSEIGR